jgi:hypothetical protein
MVMVQRPSECTAAFPAEGFAATLQQSLMVSLSNHEARPVAGPPSSFDKLRMRAIRGLSTRLQNTLANPASNTSRRKCHDDD